MPYPRFEKLALKKREQLLDAAAREFAAHGFEQASINRILEQAHMSKGAAYYYFEDKVDLFFTVVQYANERLTLIDEDVDAGWLTAQTYWSTFARLHREPLLLAYEQPYLFAALRAARHLPQELIERTDFAKRLIAYAMTLIKRGQEIGVVRKDIADELIFAWLQALDDAGDRWLLARWTQLTREDIANNSDLTVDAIRRVLAPSMNNEKY